MLSQARKRSPVERGLHVLSSALKGKLLFLRGSNKLHFIKAINHTAWGNSFSMSRTHKQVAGLHQAIPALESEFLLLLLSPPRHKPPK